MKLDRNINPDGRGKYALLKLRNIKLSLDAIQVQAEKSFGRDALDLGTYPVTEFFVIKLKDKYAGPALRAYAEAARADDEEYAAEIDALAQSSDRWSPKQKPD
jgi:hypothetical protein